MIKFRTYSSSIRISRIWQAAFATGVPGPKIAATPALYRDNTAGNYHDIFTTQLFQFFHNLRNQRLVSGSQ